MSALLKAFQQSSYLYGGNAEYIEELYEAYLQNPDSVNGEWRTFFDKLQEGHGHTADVSHQRIIERLKQLSRQPRTYHTAHAAPTLDKVAAEKQAAVTRLINEYRTHGHQAAHLDPLRLEHESAVPSLEPAYHYLDDADLDTVFDTGGLANQPRLPLRKILDTLKTAYCRNIGAEFMHITNTEERLWLQTRLEGPLANPKLEKEQRLRVLDRLTAAEGLEKHLHSKYVGQKRFSLEGGESLIPLLDTMCQQAGANDVEEVVIGMSHRGRLNVLVNIMGKAPQDLFKEFEGKYDKSKGSGDVKYHQGFSSDVNTPGGAMHLTLGFNPSHLEIIAPVVEGSVRARQRRSQDTMGDKVLAVLMHGDAAFAGQGVVMETFNMSQTHGYSTGGTIHIVVNNQVGFTTSDPHEARSTPYCTDVAKMVEAPIFHVNADDAEAVALIAQLAVEYRKKFRKDIVIDLFCYRRHGHNEADEPAATQPIMYQHIKKHATTRALYAQKLAADGVISEADAQALAAQYRKDLEAGKHVALDLIPDGKNPRYKHSLNWHAYTQSGREDHPKDVGETAIPLELVRELSAKLEALPQNFVLHPRVAKIMDDRRKMAAGALSMDWGYAETLAYAALLHEGGTVRISGQDSGRGTFFHRHAILHNQKDGQTYLPLQSLTNDPSGLIIINSLLSEEAVLGFEYGYSTTDPNALVVWEAQFGDFANGAQVVIDQFISSGEIKWGRLCGLVLMLPHGYEGQGPEHSSARLERFMQLCAEYNMRVCMPSTPAQMFHLLRRQIKHPLRKPLIIMSPKSLLRHKLSVSTLEDITDRNFQPLIGEIDSIDAKKVKRIVLCSGKVYFDLLEARREQDIKDIAIVRVEQLYPFPLEEMKVLLAQYENLKEIVWCQEEPKNQGVWYQSNHHFRECTQEHQTLSYAGRDSSASPAAGYHSLHVEQQKALIAEALNLKN